MAQLRANQLACLLEHASSLFDEGTLDDVIDALRAGEATFEHPIDEFLFALQTQPTDIFVSDFDLHEADA